MGMLWRTLLVLVMGLVGVSCARYEYDLLRPEDRQSHIGVKDEVTVEEPPLRFRMVTVDNRLVVRVYNMTEKPIQLVGVKSFVVDPAGQSRAVKSQVIPGGAFVKFVLPPVRPEFVGQGGQRIVGYGPGLGRGEFGFGYDEPERYTLVDGGEVYWNWEGEGSATMTLVFEVEKKELTQSFTFGRRRMD